MHTINKNHSKTQSGFALLALILYLGGLITLCISSFASTSMVQNFLAKSEAGIYSISDMARMCAEDMAQRLLHIEALDLYFTSKVYGHDCIFLGVTDLPNLERKVLVRFNYFEHGIYWWIVISADGLTVVREKI